MKAGPSDYGELRTLSAIRYAETPARSQPTQAAQAEARPRLSEVVFSERRRRQYLSRLASHGDPGVDHEALSHVFRRHWMDWLQHYCLAEGSLGAHSPRAKRPPAKSTRVRIDSSEERSRSTEHHYVRVLLRGMCDGGAALSA